MYYGQYFWCGCRSVGIIGALGFREYLHAESTCWQSAQGSYLSSPSAWSPGAFCQRLFVSLGRIATTSSLLLESRGGYSERFLVMILAAHHRRHGQRIRRACPRGNCCKRSVRSMRSKPSLPFESHRYLTSKCFFELGGSAMCAPVLEVPVDT